MENFYQKCPKQIFDFRGWQQKRNWIKNEILSRNETHRKDEKLDEMTSYWLRNIYFLSEIEFLSSHVTIYSPAAIITNTSRGVPDYKTSELHVNQLKIFFQF